MNLYELAYALHMPVYKILTEMPYEEYVNWSLYFSERPMGWREDSRVMKLLAVQGVKSKGSEIFESLKKMEEFQAKVESENNGVNIGSLKNSALFARMLNAVGGDKIL